MTPPLIVYSITTVHLPSQSTSCWGLHSSLEAAVRHLADSADSFSEAGYYQYAVIEAVPVDARPYDKNPTWLELRPLEDPITTKDDETGIMLRQEYEAVILKETPEWARNIMGWGIG